MEDAVETCHVCEFQVYFCAFTYLGGWWEWALVSPDGVVPSRMVDVSASVNLPLHHKVQKFCSGTGSPGLSWKMGHKTVVCVCVWWLHTWCEWYVVVRRNLQLSSSGVWEGARRRRDGGRYGGWWWRVHVWAGRWRAGRKIIGTLLSRVKPRAMWEQDTVVSVVCKTPEIRVTKK